MRLEREYELQAAHRLTAGVPEGHPCRRLHGHRYIITLGITGEVHPETGMILEYEEIDQAVAPVFKWIDHRFLNHLGIDEDSSTDWIDDARRFKAVDEAKAVRKNSTVELLAKWLVAELAPRFEERFTHGVGKISPRLAFVRIQEDSRSTIEVWVGEK